MSSLVFLDACDMVPLADSSKKSRNTSCVSGGCYSQLLDVAISSIQVKGRETACEGN